MGDNRLYWTYDRCKEVCDKFESISEFRKSNGGAYASIHKNNWNELLDHMRIMPNFYKRLIYVYEFPDNTCYIGLTCDIERRHYQHLNEKSQVSKHIKETKLTPTLKVITDLLFVNDAIKMENKVLNEYKNNKWVILNKNKTGSIGCTILYWTKEKCIDELLKYNNYGDFRKYATGAHNSSFKNGWLYEILEEYIGHKKRKSPK